VRCGVVEAARLPPVRATLLPRCSRCAVPDAHSRCAGERVYLVGGGCEAAVGVSDLLPRPHAATTAGEPPPHLPLRRIDWANRRLASGADAAWLRGLAVAIAAQPASAATHERAVSAAAPHTTVGPQARPPPAASASASIVARTCAERFAHATPHATQHERAVSARAAART